MKKNIEISKKSLKKEKYERNMFFLIFLILTKLSKYRKIKKTCYFFDFSMWFKFILFWRHYMKKGNNIKIILFMVIILFLTGCSSIKPITQNIINDVGGNDEIIKFQYYVSKKIVLKHVKQTRDEQIITKTGKASITDVVSINRIVIFQNTMGVVLKNYRDEKDNLILEICFEDDDSKRITFKQDGIGSDKRFYIMYQDIFYRKVNYGGEEYTVDFSGDTPYLKIKINKQLKQKIKTKWASGRRVQN
jgi:predicted nucleic acid-binding protein